MNSNKPSTIGVLTSGGDAPGMNAAIRAVVRAGIAHGFSVVGFVRGYKGLIEDNYIDMNSRSVSDIIHRGGTFLYTARCKEMMTDEGRDRAAEVCRKHNLAALVCIGGDGTFRGANELSKRGINVMCIPATIDNDIGATDYCLGFDTTINTVTEMVDKIRDTSQSHDRCTVVEVMGRSCGFVALHAGLAVGATSILIPEISHDFQRDVIDRITSTSLTGKKHFIVLVAEGVGGSAELAKKIEETTGIETKVSILGYVQRGGSPTSRDRTSASRMGYRAVELAANGEKNRMLVTKEGKIKDINLSDGIGLPKMINERLYKMAMDINS